MTFTVVITEDPEEKGIFNASVPALPGCHTWGGSAEEAFENAKDAVETYLEASQKAGDHIPLEVTRQITVAQ